MNRRKFFAVIATIILSSMLILSFAISISNDKQQEKVTFYLVTNGSASDKNKAIADAVTVKSRGGAGYLHEVNGKNYVVLCCYSEKDDAYAIANRIQNSQVVELKISSSKNPTRANIQKLGIEISNKLYDLSVSYDTGKIDVKTLRTALKKQQENIESKMIIGSSDATSQTALLEFSSSIDNLLTCNESFLDWNLKFQRVKILCQL